MLVREALSAWVGRLDVVPWSAKPDESSQPQVLVPGELAHLLPRRSAFSYKGDYGKLAIVAGSRGFTGAPVLCAQAAQAIGAGLLSVVTHADAAEIVAAQAPHEAMVSGWANLDETPKVITGATALVVGPGLGTSAESEKNAARRAGHRPAHGRRRRRPQPAGEKSRALQGGARPARDHAARRRNGASHRPQVYPRRARRGRARLRRGARRHAHPQGHAHAHRRARPAPTSSTPPATRA
ncbi:MAG: NAD(P)H-hydrate dehydratase [Verrucomicrobiota bacterium]